MVKKHWSSRARLSKLVGVWLLIRSRTERMMVVNSATVLICAGHCLSMNIRELPVQNELAHSVTCLQSPSSFCSIHVAERREYRPGAQGSREVWLYPLVLCPLANSLNLSGTIYLLNGDLNASAQLTGAVGRLVGCDEHKTLSLRFGTCKCWVNGSVDDSQVDEGEDKGEEEEERKEEEEDSEDKEEDKDT